MKYLAISWIVALAFFYFQPDFDIVFSNYFYIAGEGFPFRENIVAVVFYELIYMISALIVAGFGMLCVLKFNRFILPELTERINRLLTQKQIIFILLAFILGPGLIVHQGIKELWGRERPVNIKEFGGEKDYTPPLVISESDGKSFVSGHAAVGFFMIAFAFISNRKNFKKLYAAGMIFGVAAAAMRIGQGAHFLSDTVFSALIIISVIHFLHFLMFRENYKAK